MILRRLCVVASAVFVLASTLTAQSNSAQQDAATFDSDGTAHVTRVIPMPATISPEARKWLQSLNLESRNQQTVGPPETLAERRTRTDAWRKMDSAEARTRYPVNVEETTTAGVRTDIITPLSAPENNRVLINLHGGGFNSDSGSLIEGVPIANLARIKVVSVYYRLAPENPFPAAVDDVVAVYRELLKTYKPHNIGIYGTSAGAILTAEVTVRLQRLGLPLPAALGIFSGLADFSRVGDSRQMFTLKGLVTSTRDLLLSDTATFHRALLHAGDDAQLVVFEALPHAFWYNFNLPETTEALQIMANFFDQKVGR